TTPARTPWTASARRRRCPGTETPSSPGWWLEPPPAGPPGADTAVSLPFQTSLVYQTLKKQGPHLPCGPCHALHLLRCLNADELQTGPQDDPGVVRQLQ